MNTWGDLSGFTWGDLDSSTWSELSTLSREELLVRAQEALDRLNELPDDTVLPPAAGAAMDQMCAELLYNVVETLPKGGVWTIRKASNAIKTALKDRENRMELYAVVGVISAIIALFS